ncbi:MAG: NAD(P)/FAD-dependent oxidoreductase [Terriglobia bacterium]|jgi:flavin-dependent dehydrogenase|nr:NAD(P)/FAD-dependent oxidoreductase [Terriglobia bacterium]
MEMIFDLAVIGAGPAGSASAITAAKRGLRVLLLEATPYPRHKVCGEFVSAESAEVLRYLLGNDTHTLFAAPRITTAKLHAAGETCAIPLASPAYSIPRITLDETLWHCAQSNSIDCRVDRVAEITRSHAEFLIKASSTFRARAVINATGRWSRLTTRTSKQSWIGLKAHFAGDSGDTVDLYFWKHGYCGVQAVAPGVLNACALVRQGTAKDLTEVFARDLHLATRSRTWRQTTQLFATAPVYLGPGSPVIDGILQVGDAAGFVDPFVGDGISLALRSGVLAGRCAGAVSPATYATLYREAFSGIFRSTNRIRNLQPFPAFLHPWILRALSVPTIGRHLFQQTRQSRLDVLSAPLSPTAGL